MHPLDNVIWNALNTSQAHLGASRGSARKFFKEVSLLGGFSEPSDEAYDSLSTLLEMGERVGLFLEADPQPPLNWKIVASVPLLQMLHDNGNSQAPSGTELHVFHQLGEPDVPEMLALTKLTKPGPFAIRTREMGDYFGIRKDGVLVAMAGERLRLPGFTEISAVCTHPEHLGRGYARRLLALLLSRIQGRGERAFLHVREENARAVELYERMGFRKRVLLRYGLLSKEPRTPLISTDSHG
ncbi:MAG: GNAT family N-acetyltransferase [Terriglobales bacterium]|jgi:ribosomal protein S18 acetylase RimI-like enzyme